MDTTVCMESLLVFDDGVENGHDVVLDSISYQFIRLDS